MPSQANPPVARPGTRRRFLQTASLAVAAPLILPGSVWGQNKRPAPSGRIAIGVIGVGVMGMGDMNSFLDLEDAQVVAVCDVDRLHYRDKDWGKGAAYGREPAKKRVETYYAKENRGGTFKGCQAYSDFRELCARPDIDAVVVATPDHWHALCTLEALRHGKDVYCEKPVTHLFREGQLVYREVAKRKAVFQTGSQQRSTANFHHAVELVLNGHLGKVREVEVGLPAGYKTPLADATVQEPPEHLDYDFWCGPSEVLPYMRARHHRLWRGHLAYGGGNIMDWIGHHNDIAHWGLGLDHGGPEEIEAVGWTYPETKIYNTPVDYEIRCRYPGGIQSSIASRHKSGTKWIGETGWVYVDRNRLQASNPAWVKSDFEPGPVKAYRSLDHHQNFLDCVKSRKACIAPAETAHRSVTPGHLGYVA
ncbi:MAG: Gfo/Idh/MocA family oxidoreductase, partial [Pedosphaera parvula]|nr:Gfo/Idh/MocA family oxidoreductase [Pedosphaera parvula]